MSQNPIERRSSKSGAHIERGESFEPYMAPIDTSRPQGRGLNLQLDKWVLGTFIFCWAMTFWSSIYDRFDPHNLLAVRLMLLFSPRDTSSQLPMMLSDCLAWAVAIFGIVICAACAKWATMRLWSLREAVVASWSSTVAGVAGLSELGHAIPPSVPQTLAPLQGILMR